LRWRGIKDSEKGDLRRIVLSRSYNTRSDKVKATKTGATKIVPEHTYLARLLREWWETGFHEWTGRDPEPEDLILPNDIDGTQWSNWTALKRHYEDLELLGIPQQRQCDSRATFRNLLMCAGAQEFHVNLMTHSKKEKASDFYTRIEMQWPALCDAILKLKHPAWERPPKVTVRVTVGDGPRGGGGEKPAVPLRLVESRHPDLNRGPTVYETVALPTELCRP
jgi:hypothetical protein